MKFKAKPIEIQAWRWDCGEPLPDWVTDGSQIFFDAKDYSSGYIRSMEGDMDFTYEHWILLDTEGNPYPCHETVFEKKYERV